MTVPRKKGPQAKQKQREADERRKKGTAKPANESARAYLNNKEMAMPLDKLHQYLRDKKGFNVSRATAWRAKRTGYFYPQHVPTFGAKRIKLTLDERSASVDFLVKRFGFTRQTAREAKRRGWFTVDVNTRGRIRIPADRYVPPAELKPELVVERVDLTQEERQAFPDFLAKRFGISRRTAAVAKERGWFKVLPAMRGKLRIPNDRKMPSIFPGKKVELTTSEMQTSLDFLVNRFGIHRTTAAVAKERGFFIVMSQHMGKTRIPVNRVVGMDETRYFRRGRPPKPGKK